MGKGQNWQNFHTFRLNVMIRSTAKSWQLCILEWCSIYLNLLEPPREHIYQFKVRVWGSGVPASTNELRNMVICLLHKANPITVFPSAHGNEAILPYSSGVFCVWKTEWNKNAFNHEIQCVVVVQWKEELVGVTAVLRACL